jgi:c-di-GMP-binding flagellar brake protein YcgR
MNLQPLTVEDIPIGTPLPWQIYDRDGYTLFARGETIASRRLLESLIDEGLLRDVDALPEPKEIEGSEEFSEHPPSEMFPPRGIKPQVWERVQLRLLGRDVQAFYNARLIGYIKDQSILVTMPVVDGQRVIMTDGEKVEVRMLTGSNIYVFQSMILRVCVSPSNYMHLEYPAKVRTQRLRRAPWARTNLAASVTDANGNEVIAHIVNLSPDGAQVNIPQPVGKKGESLRLAFHARIDELETKLTLDSAIQHIRPAQQDQDWGAEMLGYGLAFRNVSAEDALWLRCLVYQRIAEGYLI